MKDTTHENSELTAQVGRNENAISDLSTQISDLSSEIDRIKRENEHAIRQLEQDRQMNEDKILDLKKRQAELNLEVQNTQILIQKQKNEVDYINTEQEKFKSQSYADKVNRFKSQIDECQRKTDQMRNELEALHREWEAKLARAAQKADSALQSGPKSKIVQELMEELRAKQRELSMLESQRQAWEREASPEGSYKDSEIQRLREQIRGLNSQFLAVLEEQNRIYEDLTTQTKELINLNGEIQVQVQESSRFKQEYEFLSREFAEREKLLHGLQADVADKQRLIDALKDQLARKQEEFEELQGVLRDAMNEGRDLDSMISERDSIIAQLEAQLKQINIKREAIQSTTVTTTYQQQSFIPESDIDAHFADWLARSGCKVPFKKLGGGYYIFGTKKVYAKILNSQLVIRVGGGYMGMEEFIATYGESEMNKVNQI